MCRTKSGLTLRGGIVIVISSTTDKHEILIAQIKARDKGLDELVRWEVTPTACLTDFSPDAWEFRFDNGQTAPSWWDPEYETAAIREALVVVQKQFDPKTGAWTGDLNLGGTAVKSLGRVQTVGGSLYLSGTAVKSLGRLQTVGGGLSLSGTAVKSLGKCKVAGTVYGLAT